MSSAIQPVPKLVDMSAIYGEPPVQSSIDMEEDDNDKHLKVQKKSSNFFFILLAVLPCSASCGKAFVALLKNPLKAYTCYLAVGVVLYCILAQMDGVSPWEDLISFWSCVFEAYGLISVYRKIQSHRNVMGISANSLIMFAVSYILRECETLVMESNFRLTRRGFALEMIQFASVPLVVSILWSVLKTYRETYQESLDILRVQYLLPACVALALVLTPQFKQGRIYSYCWTTSFYVDILALLPQVVMMTLSPGKKIAVPIANLVAVTAFSRCVDLWFWYIHFDLGPQAWWGGFNYSGWIIVGFHLFSLLLVADFMYFYIRGRCSAQIGDDKQAVINEARGVLSL